MISCMISYLFDNIIVNYPFLALFFCYTAYDIIYISYEICYDIKLGGEGSMQHAHERHTSKVFAFGRK